MDSVRVVFASLLLATVVACSPGSANDSAIDAHVVYYRLMGEATTVVVAEVVKVTEGGAIAIRPLVTLKGELPIEDDGLYHFSWLQTDPTVVMGVWAFDAEGLPMREANAIEAKVLKAYPWPINDIDVAWAVEIDFVDAVKKEALRVLAAADAVVEAPGFPDSGELKADTTTLVVTQVMRGAEGVSVGDELSFSYPEGSSRHTGLAGLMRVWALTRVNGTWVTVPSWWYPGWTCWDSTMLGVYEAFPDYSMTQQTSYAGSCPSAQVLAYQP